MRKVEKSLYRMIEDLFKVERICNRFDIEIDEIIKDMYKTLCHQDNRFSALTEIKVKLKLLNNKTSTHYNNYYYYENYNSYNNNYYSYNTYNINSLNNDNFYFYIHILDHTTFLPIYRINISAIEDETYTILIYKKPKGENWNPIPIKSSFADKNNLKETIQNYFKYLTQDD